MKQSLHNVQLLLVEDDESLAKSMARGLAESGFECEIVDDGPSAVEAMSAHRYQVVILDLSLGDDSAIGALRCLREANDNAAIIVLSPIEFQQERLAAIEAGAEDFILKPFTLGELRARAEAGLLRARRRPTTLLETGPLALDLTSRRVTRGGRQISLTPTEFRILEILMRNHGQVVTRKMLCEFLWNPDWEGVTNVIEVHINRLRNKLNTDTEPQMVYTIRGSGYMLKWDPDAAPPKNKPAKSRKSKQAASQARD